jgi:hypothetical protein
MGVARDIAIIIVAFESIVIGILMTILVIQIIRLVRLLREEILPIINSTQETVGTVRGTAEFVSEHVVQPVVKVNSYAAGVRRGFAVFTRLRNR